MTNPFHSFDWSFKSLGKVFGAFVLGVVALAILAGIISFAFRTIVSPFGGGYGRGGVVMESSMDFASPKSMSYQNILPPIPGSEIVDLDAEDYEVHSYHASYKTSDKTEICGEVAALKSREEIIFESSNESDRSCNYRFEVENKYVDEVLEILENLDPEDLNSNIYTIQKSVEGTADRLEVLRKRLAQTEETLLEAQTSYDELTRLAKNRGDVENLTKLINLKINTIERLAQERLKINEEMEMVQRNREDQLRRIAFTEFSVNVYEEKFVDWKNIVNDWKNEIRNFVSNLNDLTQFVSVRLVSFVLYAAASLLYLAIAFGFLKLLWLLGKRMWKLGDNK